MRPYWQAFIIAIALIGLANMTGGLIFIHGSGTFGFTGQQPSLHTNSFQVQSVTAQSPAANARIHAGDTVMYAPRWMDRIMMLAPVPGDTVNIADGARAFPITAVVDNGPVAWVLFAIIFVAKLAFIAIGVIVAWRRPDDPAARALALFLTCFGAGINFDFILIPNVVARFAAIVFQQCLFLTGGLAAFAFACRFPSRASAGIRAALSRLIVPLAAAGFVITATSFATAFGDSNLRLGTIVSRSFVALYLLLIAGTLAALVDSYRRAEREQLPRMRWVLGTLALGFSGVVVLFLGLAFSPQAPWIQYAGLTVVAIPFGLGYVILRHRVIDVGFVVNRAVVYGAVSVVVVGAFIIFEWILGHVVETNSRASTIIELCAALALGLSVRFIHTRVDRYVDDLFFRDRHLAEAAIRRFAHETGLITVEDVLVHRTVEVAQRNARLVGAAFYARLKTRYVALHSTFDPTPGELDENDPTILDMRTFHNPVDHSNESIVPGAVAFPMIVRGQLAGFLACGEKATHEVLAPDEHDALQVLARDAGIALDSLRIARIEQELAYLTADGELPPALRLRLASLLDREGLAQPAGAAARSIQLIQESKSQELL